MIGERLSELRKDMGLSQQEFGKLFNLSKRTISSYETDETEPPNHLIVEFARYFDVSTDYLLGTTKYPKPYCLKESSLFLPKSMPLAMKRELEGFWTTCATNTAKV